MVAVYDGHLHVHDDEVEVVSFVDCFECEESVFDDGDIESCFGEEVFEEFLVVWAVFCDEDLSGECVGWAVLVSRVHRCGAGEFGGEFVGRALWDDEGEGACED